MLNLWDSENLGGNGLKLYDYIDSSLIYYVHNFCVENEIIELN